MTTRQHATHMSPIAPSKAQWAYAKGGVQKLPGSFQLAQVLLGGGGGGRRVTTANWKLLGGIGKVMKWQGSRMWHVVRTRACGVALQRTKVWWIYLEH